MSEFQKILMVPVYAVLSVGIAIGSMLIAGNPISEADFKNSVCTGLVAGSLIYFASWFNINHDEDHFYPTITE